LEREGAHRARDLLKSGVDPSVERKLEKIRKSISTDTGFEAVAREWQKNKASGWAESHAATTLTRLKKDLFPWIGTRSMSEIDAPELLATLRRVEARGAIETAHRLREIVGQVFRYAITTGRASRNPAADLPGTLKIASTQHHGPCKVGDLVRAMRGYRGSPVVHTALQFSAQVFQRRPRCARPYGRRSTWTERCGPSRRHA